MTATTTQESMTATSIQNFRQALGLPRIYRCSSTDGLADLLEQYESFDDAPLDQSQQILLHKTGLILDLRSDSERDEEKCQKWARCAPGGPILVTDRPVQTNDRCVLRLDVLSPTRFIDYANQHWLTPSQKAMVGVYSIFDVEKVHEMRMNALNERGLAGLYQVILETAKDDLRLALQQMTLHLEEKPNNVVIHCVQGKDRTGMLVMLCQSILEMSDEDIVADYHESDVMRSSSAASKFKPPKKGKLDRRVFAGSPRKAMVDTLEFVRSQYGSVSPGYVDSIGFDESWRRRFLAAIQRMPSSKL